MAMSRLLLRAARGAPDAAPRRAANSLRRGMATATLDWRDPLQLMSQLTEEETMIMVRRALRAALQMVA